mmetsp:Transcript_3902/g.13848  ORF Transcript_3902/g.13848 Transcript_3902/m.13848 type:complete len:239 (-) Transcript_3902:271-987(-)
MRPNPRQSYTHSALSSYYYSSPSFHSSFSQPPYHTIPRSQSHNTRTHRALPLQVHRQTHPRASDTRPRNSPPLSSTLHPTLYTNAPPQAHNTSLARRSPHPRASQSFPPQHLPHLLFASSSSPSSTASTTLAVSLRPRPPSPLSFRSSPTRSSPRTSALNALTVLVHLQTHRTRAGTMLKIPRRLLVNLPPNRARREHLTSAPTNTQSTFENCSKRRTWGAIRARFASNTPRASFAPS